MACTITFTCDDHGAPDRVPSDEEFAVAMHGPDTQTRAKLLSIIADEVSTPGNVTASKLSGQYASKSTEEAIRRQAILYADFMLKLRCGDATTICALGDSTTYGHDAVSADKVPAPPGVLPDGTFHENTRSPAPWPGVLAAKLTEVYPAGVTVINRGRTGDTVTKALTRWIKSSGAGLTLISFGINDATHLTLEQFIDGYEKLILREINEYGAAVVILTPIRQRVNTGTASIDVYRNALDALAMKYGLPIIDGQAMLAGHREDVFSDSWHLNTAGNAIMGARLAACFIGAGPANPNPVGPGSHLSTRPTIDNLVIKGGARITTGGVSARMDGSTSLFYSFYATAADVVVVPYYYIGAGNQLDFILDFGIPQPPKLQDIYSATAAPDPSSVSHAPTNAVTHTSLSAGSKALTIPSTGWHTLEIKGAGGTSYPAVQYIYYLEFLDYRAYRRAIA